MGPGWASAALVAVPRTTSEVAELIATPGQHLARGLGRSYGDAAQCAGGTVIDCTCLDRVIELDWAGAKVRVEAGCSLDALLRAVVPQGFFVPVTPGTRYVSLGGAVASDVHGKNHHRDGTIGAHVQSLSSSPRQVRSAAGPTRSPSCSGRQREAWA